MKKLFIMAALVAATTTTFAQSVDLRRKIEVTGIAEKEVTPDILNVSISLKEYMDGKKKITISQLEQQLEKAVQEAGIPKEDFTVMNVSSWNYIIQKKKNPEFLASKQYGLRVRDLNKYNQILSKIDAKGIQYTNIDSYDYSKMAEVKKELKIQALLAARDKATYLLTSLGDKLGGAINIVENDNSNYPQPLMYKAANMMVREQAADASAPESDIDFKKIKLSFQIQAVFEIK
ncbi:SIMPL domain-containing protein [Mucilaginibacter hurinus]|uniref:SIMPL domain-containing protein n=1 Tax=Mucilaginibacter hurinus TaxID=2201324 RepID=A0A367GNC6_9SPHI|nr:SIMPL domain-containing protein [Mucilaginibacter hurinus]RCH54969.1 SIMPL domain-containing protein [Mucilaginibacter hurinus]